VITIAKEYNVEGKGGRKKGCKDPGLENSKKAGPVVDFLKESLAQENVCLKAIRRGGNHGT